MGTEIERKFLVHEHLWKTYIASVRVQRKRFKQGYLGRHIDGATVRLRVVYSFNADDSMCSDLAEKAFLTIKGPTSGISRNEYEYAIPVEDAEQMLQSLSLDNIIDKYRYTVDFEGTEWVVDDFLGNNVGLLVAEVELSHEDQKIDFPPWLGVEVSFDKRYSNASLAQKPFTLWQ